MWWIPPSPARPTASSTLTQDRRSVSLPPKPSPRRWLCFTYSRFILGQVRGKFSKERRRQYIRELLDLPDKLETLLKSAPEACERLADKFYKVEDFLFMGRAIHYPVAMDGALKLKEVSYIHAEGYPTGETKHGPNAMIDENLPVVIIATCDRNDSGSVLRYEKNLANIRGFKQQSARVIAIASEGDEELQRLADHTIFVPHAPELLLPLLEIVPLQLFAYYMTVKKGLDVDRPQQSGEVRNAGIRVLAPSAERSRLRSRQVLSACQGHFGPEIVQSNITPGQSNMVSGVSMREVVIVSSVRTPVGRAFKGTLRATRPDELAAIAIKGALERVPQVDPKEIEDVILGCATPEAEQGTNVARIASLRAGLPVEVSAITINRFCSSGLQAIAMAAERIMSGGAEIIVAGGTESMSMIPMGGHKISPNPWLVDHYPDAYLTMGLTAERVAQRLGITRQAADEFSLRSHQKALAAIQAGKFTTKLCRCRSASPLRTARNQSARKLLSR